jgi:hypothetical protein
MSLMLPLISSQNTGRRIGDPFFSSVSVLLHFDGAVNSTNIIDSGPLNLPFTTDPAGNARLVDSYVRFGPTAFGVLPNGWARTPSGGPFSFGAGDFTVECWPRKLAATAGTQALCAVWRASPLSLSWYFGVDSSNRLFFYYSINGTAGVFSAFSSTGIPTNQFAHVAASREGANLRIFVNGTLTNTHNIGSSYIFDAVAPFSVGNDSGETGQPFSGAIDEMRITKGVARYTESFSVPTKPFPDFGS